jgi:hypothetical protein
MKVLHRKQGRRLKRHLKRMEKKAERKKFVMDMRRRHSAVKTVEKMGL